MMLFHFVLHRISKNVLKDQYNHQSNADNKAKKIDIAVYSINNDNIVEAVLKAHENGTKIHIVTDRTQAKGKWSKVNNIKDSGIPLRINRKHKIEHNKFAVFDNEVVVTGSYNWTNPATSKDSENCIFITDPKGKFTERFQYLWNFYQPE